ncbi:MAG: DUF523 domain-containing protein [Candidatus Aureabacteria bacterium]|nr:DUF523 domain-containing protein [Candidatus Auribacterota bacterium]
MNKPKAIISACLAGEKCRYDGGTKTTVLLDELRKSYDLVLVCPELLGGLSVPREKACILGKDGNHAGGMSVIQGTARVLMESGKDVTSDFIKGAKKIMELVKNNQIKTAFLKSRSPSCGYGTLSTPNGLITGNGILTEMLLMEGMDVREVHE